MNWKTFPEEKPNHGDIVVIRTAPEQGSSYRVTPFCEDTEWIDGDQWLKLNGAKRKPLSDGTLPMEEGEKAELAKLIGFSVVFRVVYASDHLCAYLSPYHKPITVDNVKAILWLADRFELSSNN